MARLVKRIRNTPYEVCVGAETKFICACGLSGTLPFCDGTHTITNAEEQGQLLWYDMAKRRHPVIEEYPGILSEAPVVLSEEGIPVVA